MLMQKTLFEALSEIQFSYYDIPINAEDLFIRKGACEEFIHEQFTRGHKSSVLKVNFLDEYKQQGKHEHTVALYLLGLYLQNQFNLEIRGYFEKYIPEVKNWYSPKEFMYFWYLTCLYHDVASCVEKDPDTCYMCSRYCPKRHFPRINGKKFIPYSKSTVTNYCRYRQKSGKRDHGICGGTMLYLKLRNNFLENTKGHNLPWTDPNGLIWRDEQKDVFACAAGAIICHNMWTVKADDEERVKKYQANGLDELIISGKEDKLSIDDYPLQFMLCFLDTIEPTKRFPNLTVREVLGNISIEASKKREITIAWTTRIKEQATFEGWIENISTMKDWMKVYVSACKQEGGWCYITITIL